MFILDKQQLTSRQCEGLILVRQAPLLQIALVLGDTGEDNLEIDLGVNEVRLALERVRIVQNSLELGDRVQGVMVLEDLEVLIGVSGL